MIALPGSIPCSTKRREIAELIKIAHGCRTGLLAQRHYNKFLWVDILHPHVLEV